MSIQGVNCTAGHYQKFGRIRRRDSWLTARLLAPEMSCDGAGVPTDKEINGI